MVEFTGKLNLAILISGRGSNMRALVEACADPDFPARVMVVIANRPDAAGLAWAAERGLPTALVDHMQYPDKAAFEAALQDVLEHQPVDLVCLAGFMRVLSRSFVENWTGRIVNIHPSLLPDYPGLNIHERVLADKRTESGCSVHFVTPELDAGPVIVQKKVPVAADDTPETLAARILAEEHKAYPEAICRIAAGDAKFIEKQA